ncbi:hypothetical protein Dsin_000057 [Dipteronia sinensis]|uniref:Uncharacterized protein n=1 Tax=Dipteronia sinensis TaxID=43782 RepID=A0AAE0DJE2_9ROSI|nr:hypothetical protein Dsin_000057 [Dipteronia sinensis]
MRLSNGTTNPIAKCKFCPKDCTSSRQGTDDLRRHMEKCMSAHGQSGLKEVSARIDRIRYAVPWIESSNQRFREFSRHCRLNGLRPRRFQTDMPIRWNSTYLMLQNCLDYDTTITGLIVDPRVKLSGLEFFLEFIETNLTLDYSERIIDIRNKLFEVFSIYDRKFGGIDMQPSAEPET